MFRKRWAGLLLFPNSHLGLAFCFLMFFFSAHLERNPTQHIGAHIAAVKFSVLGCDLKMKNYSRVKNRLLLEFSFFVNKWIPQIQLRKDGLYCYTLNNLLPVLIVICMITEIRKPISSGGLFLHTDKYKSNFLLVPRCWQVGDNYCSNNFLHACKRTPETLRVMEGRMPWFYGSSQGENCQCWLQAVSAAVNYLAPRQLSDCNWAAWLKYFTAPSSEQ